MTRPLGDKPARKISIQVSVEDDLFEILDRVCKEHPDLYSSRADAARALMWAGMCVVYAGSVAAAAADVEAAGSA